MRLLILLFCASLASCSVPDATSNATLSADSSPACANCAPECCQEEAETAAPPSCCQEGANQTKDAEACGETAAPPSCCQEGANQTKDAKACGETEAKAGKSCCEAAGSAEKNSPN